MECKYCQGEIHPDRVELGKDYCMSNPCINEHNREWASTKRVMLMPKQGFALVDALDPALKAGKSSGRL